MYAENSWMQFSAVATSQFLCFLIFLPYIEGRSGKKQKPPLWLLLFFQKRRKLLENRSVPLNEKTIPALSKIVDCFHSILGMAD